MKILFYQLDSKYKNMESYKVGKYFGHPLFGATHFPKYGIDVVMWQDKHVAFFEKFRNRFKFDLRLVWHSIELLFTARKYDVLYGPYPKGLGLIMAFRSIGLFNKPIVIYSHQGIPNPKNPIKKALVKLAYAGSDKVLFFSQEHFENALREGLINPEKCYKINWGPDLAFYDRALAEMGTGSTDYFISTGKAQRDYDTLVNALGQTDAPAKIFVDTEELEKKYAGKASNVDIVYLPVSPTSPSILIKSLNNAIGMVICTKKARGLVGITNMYEAMAFSKPVVITRNSTIDFDASEEGIGITVDLYDEEGWKNAIEYLFNNPEKAKEMGRKGRELCEKRFNLDIFAGEVANILLEKK